MRNLAFPLSLLLLCACPTPDDSAVDDTSDTGSETITPADSPTLPARGFYAGVLPLPATGQELDDSYAMAAEHAEWAPIWASGIGATSWWDYPDALGGFGGEAFVDGLVRDNGMFPLVHFSFMGQDPATGLLTVAAPAELEGATLSDPAWREAYKTAVVDATRASRPLYLSVGNEVNRWYEQEGMDGDNGFTHWVSLYEETYDAVKEVSPDTVVLCVFAREMVGELHEADLTALDHFDPDRMDLVALTTYPHSVRKDAAGEMLEHPFNLPADIPDDYYAAATGYFPGKELVFTEATWPSLEPFGGEAAQADFLGEITTRLTDEQDADLLMLGWPWLHDLPGGDASGLLAEDGTEKLVYEAWKEL